MKLRLLYFSRLPFCPRLSFFFFFFPREAETQLGHPSSCVCITPNVLVPGSPPSPIQQER